MSENDLDRAVLEFVRRANYRPIKPRGIAKRLGLSKPEAMEVKRAVKRLVAQGLLRYSANHLVESAEGGPPQGNRIVGVFRRAEAGYGFVRPQSGPKGELPDRDIYVPRPKTLDAATGDTVAVRLLHRRGHKDREMGPRGEIVEVIRRDTHRFVGTYQESEAGGFVRVDGSVFAAPVSVGDPGAHGARPDDKVVIEMVRFPTHWHDGEGVIVEVLGARGTPGVDTQMILREFELSETFAEEALDDARRQAEAFEAMIERLDASPEAGQKLPNRLDLTDLVTLTIDPVDARDFDDAISLERLDNGHWRLGVHIADVSYFVRPRSPLDREASQRATSVYLPDRVVPMLPELISNALASLQPGKVRLTKTAFLEFTPEGVRVDSELVNSAIKSRKRLTYEQVDQYISDAEPWRKKLGGGVFELLGRMRALARVLRGRRIKRGALELTLPEVKIDLDRQGRVVGAHVCENTESHQIIEEFMLAANEAVAELLAEKGFVFLRRIHRPPSALKLKALAEFVEALHLPSDIPTDGLQSRFALQELLAAVADRPERHAVNFSVLRAMQRAVYGPAEEGHYALASDCYCHFTSPIRRYPDLTVHRLVDEVLAGNKPVNNADALFVLGQHCSDREQQAEAAERELNKLKLLSYLAERIGEELDAVITGVEQYGFFAQGVQLPAEGLVPVDSLADDYYRFDRAARTLAGYRTGHSFRLGDQVRVAVARVDLDRRELDFRLIEHRARTTKKVARPARGRGKGKAAPARPKPAPRKKAKRGKRL